MTEPWPVHRLGDVCKIVMGQSPDGETYNTTGLGMPLINGPVEFSPDAFGRTIRSKYTTQPTKLCKADDLILCVRGSTTGRMNIAGFDGCIGRGVAAIRANTYQPWINHFINFKRTEIHGKGSGATFPNVSGAVLAAISIPMPPLPEQRRIVAIFDEAFEGIAAAKANAEKNLQNARELFESALDAALSHHGGDFAETTLADETDLVAGYAFSSKGYTDAADGMRLLRGDNIMQGYLRWDDAKGWPVYDAAPYARFALQQGDVVLAMDRPWVKAGLKRAQIGADDLPCLQLQRTARLRPRRSMSVDFLFHLTGSKSFSRHLLSVQTGLGVPHISGKQIESFRFMLPSRNEQKTIASKLDDLQQRTERLEEIYQQKVTALDEFKKALLHQAFTGALIDKTTEGRVAEVA